MHYGFVGVNIIDRLHGLQQEQKRLKLCLNY